MEGERLGPYRLLAPLGRGGMGTVYRAEVQKTVAGLPAGTVVALKVIHGHLLETEGFFKRFLREAQIGREVEHANVVRTYDCDAVLVDGKQHNFLVMEHVEGQTLRDLLDELDRVPEELCRHIGSEVAKGLAAIHAAGVVHRDLKPENVLITPDHVVKVMDLGVARLTDEAIRLSQAGAFVGSLEYAAPEQFQTEVEPDGRADLHALGVVLYELATGRHPYRDEDASRLLRNLLDKEPRRAGEINPQLSPFFEEAVHTLLAKDRDERFASAVEVAAVFDEGEEGVWWRTRARELRVQTKRPLRRIRIPRETALYGRDEDLERLHRLYDAAKIGDGQVLLVEGEAGIGKTRLVDEFVGRLQQAGEDVHFLFGSYLPGGAATAAGAFSTAYREHYGEEGLEDALKAHLAVTPLLVPAFAALLRGDAAPTGAEPLTKDSLQTVFVHATHGLASERPTVVLIDDLHFAPEEGRALFSSLAMAVPGRRILLIGTLRPGVDEQWVAGVTRLDHAHHGVLARLGPKDLAALLEDAFHSERLANELGMQIARKSDGNPFFAFEIIRGLREGQFITRKPDGTWVSTQVIQDVEVPSSVVDMVRARLQDLTDEERELLDVASCCGFEFEPGLVAEVVGWQRIPTLRAFGRMESRQRLVRSAGRRYAFDHHQVQEALYLGLHDELRAEYHAAIGEALERRAGIDPEEAESVDGELGVDLCGHFLKGGRGDRARPYYKAAFRHLADGFLNDQAVRLADRALAAPGMLEGEERATVLLWKNERLALLGRRGEQEQALTEALELAQALGLASHEHSARMALGNLRWWTGRYDEACDEFERGVAVAREANEPEWEFKAVMGQSVARFHQGRFEEVLRLIQRATGLIRGAGQSDAVAQSDGVLGNVYSGLGRFHEAMACWERALAFARKTGNRHSQAIFTTNLGNGYRYRDELAEAMRHYEEGLAIARQIGGREPEAIALVNLGHLFLALGAPEHAQANLDACLAICTEIGAPYPHGFALWAASRLAEERGDLQRALALATEGLALRRELGHEDGIADSLRQIGAIHELLGDEQAAREAFGEAIAIGERLDRRPHLAETRALLACLPGEDAAPAEAAFEAAGSNGETIEIRFSLWRATGRLEHLRAAKELLDHRVAHAPEAFRASMLEHVRLHRDILAAWAEHQGGVR